MANALQRMSMLATGALAAVLSAAFLTPTANAEQTGFSSRQPIVGGQPVSIAEHPWSVPGRHPREPVPAALAKETRW